VEALLLLLLLLVPLLPMLLLDLLLNLLLLLLAVWLLLHAVRSVLVCLAPALRGRVPAASQQHTAAHSSMAEAGEVSAGVDAAPATIGKATCDGLTCVPVRQHACMNPAICIRMWRRMCTALQKSMAQPMPCCSQLHSHMSATMTCSSRCGRTNVIGVGCEREEAAVCSPRAELLQHADTATPC
jgi:hypothetical protein